MIEKVKVIVESTYPIEPKIYIFDHKYTEQEIENEIPNLVADYFFEKSSQLEVQDVSEEKLLDSISYTIEYVVEEEDENV